MIKFFIIAIALLSVKVSLYSDVFHFGVQSRGPKLVDFKDKKNGTIYDKKSKLTWMKCTLGQTYANGKCSKVKPKKYSYQEAEVACSELNLGGQSDWRLPTLFELRHIVWCKNGPYPPLPVQEKCYLPNKFSEKAKGLRPTIDKKYFSARNYIYWAKKDRRCQSNCQAAIDFGKRHRGSERFLLGMASTYTFGSDDKYVRCVSGKVFSNF